MLNKLGNGCRVSLRGGFATALMLVTALAITAAAALPGSAAEHDRPRLAQAESARPRPVQDRPAREPAPAAGAKAVPEETPEAEALRMGGLKGNCHCDVKCTSTTGQTYDPTTTILGSQLWQHIESNRLQCQSRCQAHIDANIAAWSASNSLCTAVTCSATSWVGTNVDKSKTSASSLDRSAACQAGGPLAAACCPPLTSADMVAIFTRVGDGLSSPYGLVYSASPTLDAKMRAAAQLANLSVGCPSLIVTYTLRNTTNNTVQGTVTVVYTGSTTAGPTATPGFGVNLAINTDYQLTASVACSNGREYYASGCRPKGFAIKWTFTPVGIAAEQSPQRGRAAVRVTPLD